MERCHDIINRMFVIPRKHLLKVTLMDVFKPQLLLKRPLAVKAIVLPAGRKKFSSSSYKPPIAK